MQSTRVLLALACGAGMACGGALAQSASAPTAAPAASAPATRMAALQACERAVRETLQAGRGGSAVEASFNPVTQRQPGVTDADEVTLRGDGRYRRGNGAWTNFGYSCTVHPDTANVSGVVLRGAGGGDTAPRSATAAPAAEVDLRVVSPEACESAAAAAVLRRWPQASRMSFNPDVRRLETSGAGEPMLVGQVNAVPSPGASARVFGYQCTIDPRDGRVTDVRVRD